MEQKILIVDDDPLNLSIMEEILSGIYEIASVTSGEAALQAIEATEPGLILLDIMMPGINGYQTCERIKGSDRGAHTQVILVSAKASPQERVKGYAAGADDYLVKPFDEDELLAKIRVQFRLRRVLVDLASANRLARAQNEELEELVRERTAEAINARDLTVFALAKLADSRDPETGDHLERIRSYCQLLAEQLAVASPYRDQVSPRFIDQIYRSSPLHDIGKVGIPDAILLKPGRLCNAEFEIMKRHSVIGAQALQEVADQAQSPAFLEMAIQIARSHHERWDGAGYPDGLAGDAIPLPARIVALADVFDALTSVRVYKDAFEPIVARSMIEEQAGKQFDPVIVDAFHARFNDFIALRDRDQAADQTSRHRLAG